jgi:hypothetical protein
MPKNQAWYSLVANGEDGWLAPAAMSRVASVPRTPVASRGGRWLVGDPPRSRPSHPRGPGHRRATGAVVTVGTDVRSVATPSTTP